MRGPPELDTENEEDVGYFTEINVTPLTDVFLVLLIIFMVVASASVEAERSASDESASSEEYPNERALRVQTPQGASDGAIMSKNIVVNVMPDGVIEIDGEEIDLTGVGSKLQTIDGTRQDQVVIRGDETAQYKLIVRVLSAVRGAGFSRVALATRAP